MYKFLQKRVQKSNLKSEILSVTKNGISQILDTFNCLNKKPLDELSSYMRINSNKNNSG